MNIYGMAGHLIRRLHQKSTAIFQSRMRDAGIDLTPVQFATLEAVRDNPGIDQANIAALIAYDRATIGGVVERLEQKGLVARSVNRRDRRARQVSLTERGEAAYEAIRPIVADLQDDILAGLSNEEKGTLIALIRKSTEVS